MVPDKLAEVAGVVCPVDEGAHDHHLNPSLMRLGLKARSDFEHLLEQRGVDQRGRAG